MLLCEGEYTFVIINTDLKRVESEYFDIIEVKEYSIVLRSKNTGHYWYLLEQEANGHRTFKISHKHNQPDAYHFHRNKPTINACCEYIKSHDAFHLERTMKRKRRLRSL